MIGFKIFLYEMSVLDAKKVFGFNSGFSAKELKTQYRKLSMKNHPDKGGSVELMQSINVAYDLLKGNVGSGSSKYDDKWYANVNKKYNDTAVIVRDDLIKNLDINAYIKYFESLFDEKFTSKVTKIYPDDAEIKRLNGGNRITSVHNVFYDVSFSNNDNTKVFELGLYVYLSDLMKASKGLGTSDTTYPMGVHTFAYIDSRKVKITSRDYTHTTKKNVFVKPSLVFPKTKIVGKKKGKFKKSHMLSALKAEIQAVNSGDWYYVPLGDDRFVGIYRSTMMGTAIWSVVDIYEMNERNTRLVKLKDQKMKFMGFLENEEFLNILRKIRSYSTKDAIKYLSSEYDKLHKK